MNRIKLPDEVMARLAHLGAQNDFTAWEAGDLTEWIFQQFTVKINGTETLINPKTEEEIGRHVVYNTVAHETGKVPQTIRDWHYVSIRVPYAVREKYSMLFRSHFKAIVPHCKTVADLHAMCDMILGWSDDYGGKIISVAGLRQRLDADSEQPPVWARRYKRAVRTMQLLSGDEEAPQYIRDAAGRFLKASVPLP